MSLLLTADPAPLTSDSDGVIRVGATRITLDTIVAAFRDGMTREGIVEQYPSLQLAEVYLVIGYFLYHAEEVESYLLDRQSHAAKVRGENETRFDPVGIRERLVCHARFSHS